MSSRLTLPVLSCSSTKVNITNCDTQLLTLNEQSHRGTYCDRRPLTLTFSECPLSVAVHALQRTPSSPLVWPSLSSVCTFAQQEPSSPGLGSGTTQDLERYQHAVSQVDEIECMCG